MFWEAELLPLVAPKGCCFDIEMFEPLMLTCCWARARAAEKGIAWLFIILCWLC